MHCRRNRIRPKEDFLSSNEFNCKWELDEKLYKCKKTPPWRREIVNNFVLSHRKYNIKRITEIDCLGAVNWKRLIAHTNNWIDSLVSEIPCQTQRQNENWTESKKHFLRVFIKWSKAFISLSALLGHIFSIFHMIHIVWKGMEWHWS